MAGTGERIERDVLENGLVVLVRESSAVPAFAAALTFLAGSRDDPPERAGLAALTGDLLVDDVTDGEDGVPLRIESLGASIDVLTGYETTTLLTSGLAETAPDVLVLLAELARQRCFDRNSVDAAKRGQLTEIADEENDPYFVCRREFLNLVFPEHPRGRPVSGFTTSVGAITEVDVSAFHRTRHVPGKAILAVTGAVDTAAIQRTIRSAFSDWEGDGLAGKPPPVPRRITGIERRNVELMREQAHLCLGGPGIARDDPRYYAASILDVILGDSAGFGSRLATRLREDEGLAYVVESDVCGTAGRDPGIFWAYTATSPEHVARAVCVIEEEMRRALAEPPSHEELHSAIAYLRGRHILRLETNESRAVHLVRTERFGFGLDYDTRYPALIGAVTADDVLSAARGIIDPDNYALVVVGPSRSFLGP
jgi:zinc protease